MSSRTTPTVDETRPAQSGAGHWRVVDIVVGAVLAVACGLIFWAWDGVGNAWFTAMDALTPGLGGLASGIWFLGGTLGALVIRKPGAALFIETLAAVVEMAIGNQWGITNVTSGFFQGLATEIVFLIVRYRVWNVLVAMIAGAAAGFGAWANELFIGQTPNITMGLAYNVIYLISNVVSGAVLAGLLGWIITKALARTGALNRFAAGRAA